MMIPLRAGISRGQRLLRQLLSHPKTLSYLRGGAYFLAGFLLSAAALENGALPLAVGLVAACNGWSGVLAAGGSALGYRLFWNCPQTLYWTCGALIAALLLSDRRIQRQVPLLMPALMGLLVSGCGVLFQLLAADDTAIGLYLLRVALAVVSTWLFRRVLESRNPILDWLACGLGVLALAQLGFGTFSLGFVAGGTLAVMGAFPAAALAGVMLDLTGLPPVSMTAVLCGGYLLRFLPRYPKWMLAMAPTTVCLFFMAMGGVLDPMPLPGLLIGGVVGVLLPGNAKIPARRGETGVAQVRLEIAAGALTQARQLLTEVSEAPIDEDALVSRAAEQACTGCPCHSSCKDMTRIGQLSGILLHKPLLSARELPLECRKSSRVLAQLHRAQEQLRSIQADRQRQQEYREAVTQQYLFLSRYLQSLSDQLALKNHIPQAAFDPKVEVFANRPAPENGDRVLRFAGVGCRYYVILCDGMGTGPGAVQEAKDAQRLLQRLLVAGYPAEHALQSLNSLCALRSRAGAVTVDLLELQLDTGRGRLFKWGAMPSYVLSPLGAQKIGTAGPPPGVSVWENTQGDHNISLQRGEVLVLVSDGVGEEAALHCCLNMEGSTPEELAQSLLTCSQFTGQDDATVVLVRLTGERD